MELSSKGVLHLKRGTLISEQDVAYQNMKMASISFSSNAYKTSSEQDLNAKLSMLRHGANVYNMKTKELVYPDLLSPRRGIFLYS